MLSIFLVHFSPSVNSCVIRVIFFVFFNPIQVHYVVLVEGLSWVGLVCCLTGVILGGICVVFLVSFLSEPPIFVVLH